jgi:hypothetical protein
MLRPRCQRPCCGRAVEQRDELARRFKRITHLSTAQDSAALQDFDPAYDRSGVKLGRGGMSALSPFSPQPRTFAGAGGTAEKCQDATYAAQQIGAYLIALVEGASVRFDAHELHHLAPFLGFVGDELAEVGG